MALNMISNFAANVAHRQLVKSDNELTDSLSKLASGTRVLAAKDDAASMAIGSRLRAEVRALTQSVVNSGQAISMLQVADGAMARTHDILLRMKTLAVQSGSGQLSSIERSMLDAEYQALVSEIERISVDTEFNGVRLVSGEYTVNRAAAPGFQVVDGIQEIFFNGIFSSPQNATISYDGVSAFTVAADTGTGPMNFTGSIATDTNDGTTMTSGSVVRLQNAAILDEIDLHINTSWIVNAAPAPGTLALSGLNYSDFSYKVGTGVSPTADQVSVRVRSMSASALGILNTRVTDIPQADIASVAISIAVDVLNTNRAGIGASQNRLEFAAANIATTLENMEAARSTLLDLDVAAEMTRFSSRQMLVQAGVAMLAQANQSPQTLLRLFQ